MKRALTVASVMLVAGIALADRTDVWSANSVSVYQVELARLADGGCAVKAWATMTKQDGGTAADDSKLTDVSGANRTTCLDILDNKAPALFKADKGL